MGTGVGAPADLVLKAACERCGAASDLYGTSCRHTTLCTGCGRAVARARGRCAVCASPVTRLIRVPARAPFRECRFFDRASDAANLGVRPFPQPGIAVNPRGALRRSTMSGWIPPRRRPTSSAGSPPACRPRRRRGARGTGGLSARMSRKDGSLPGTCGYSIFLIVDDHDHHCFVWYKLIMLIFLFN